MNGRIFVGIDFGTTNTTVCVETNGRRRMVVFANGSYLLKSIVSYKDKIPKVVMSTEITDNMQWSVLNCKRLLGVHIPLQLKEEYHATTPPISRPIWLVLLSNSERGHNGMHSDSCRCGFVDFHRNPEYS